MRFEERLQLPVPVADAWDFIWQPQRLATCLPGCVDVQELEAQRRYRARFEDHVGPYKVSFALDVGLLGSAAYKVHVAGVLLGRAIRQASKSNGRNS